MKLVHNFVKPGVFSLPSADWWGFDPADSISLEPHWTMAHIAVQMGLFPSVGQARKNGWEGPIPEGYTQRLRIGKYRLSVYIHNPDERFIQDPDWGKHPQVNN